MGRPNDGRNVSHKCVKGTVRLSRSRQPCKTTEPSLSTEPSPCVHNAT